MTTGTEHELVASRLEQRTDANASYFEREAPRLAELCRLMAERFAAGGRLLALGSSAAERSDAHHVAVEFVHPVIVGKRALPALAIVADGLALAAQVELLAEPHDMVVAFGDDADTAAALAAARGRGCLTLAFAAVAAEWRLEPPADDRLIRQELAETAYHVLWELVHVFLDHGRGSSAGAGASDFLYPFLGGGGDPGAVVADVERSIRMKASEVAAVRAQTLTDAAGTLVDAAAALRRRLDDGGTLLALGNGGSATDAADVVADFRDPANGWRARPALDLAADPAVLTAIANDVGVGLCFSRQVIALGREGDALLAISTSGNSQNVIEALAEASARGILAIALVGYDGGRVADDRLADHVVVSRSQHIPRIQEAQASALHVLRELVEAA